GTGQEGEHDAPEPGDEIDPDVRVQADQIARRNPQENFDQRRGEPHADREKRPERRETHPNRGGEVRILVKDFEHEKTPEALARSDRSHRLKRAVSRVRAADSTAVCLRYDTDEVSPSPFLKVGT